MLRSRVCENCESAGGDLQPHVEDLALPLQAHVAWPFHHPAEVARRLDVLAYAEVAGAALDEGVLLGGCEWSVLVVGSFSLGWSLWGWSVHG